MTSRANTHSEAVKALRRELGAGPPPAIRDLHPDAISALSRAIEDAKRRHSEALAVALDGAFAQVPALLRGPVKRIVLL